MQASQRQGYLLHATSPFACNFFCIWQKYNSISYLADILKYFTDSCIGCPFLWVSTLCSLSVQHILRLQVQENSLFHAGILAGSWQVLHTKLNNALAIFYFMVGFSRTIGPLNMLVDCRFSHCKLSVDSVLSFQYKLTFFNCMIVYLVVYALFGDVRDAHIELFSQIPVSTYHPWIPELRTWQSVWKWKQFYHNTIR